MGFNKISRWLENMGEREGEYSGCVKESYSKSVSFCIISLEIFCRVMLFLVGTILVLEGVWVLRYDEATEMIEYDCPKGSISYNVTIRSRNRSFEFSRSNITLQNGELFFTFTEFLWNPFTEFFHLTNFLEIMAHC